METKVHEVVTIMERAPTRAFSFLSISTFTFKNLLRLYAKRVFTHVNIGKHRLHVCLEDGPELGLVETKA